MTDTIKPTDLRINNWIADKGGNYYQVFHLLEERVNQVDPRHYLPIPLSEEILIKAGFEQYYDSEYRKKFENKLFTEVAVIYDKNSNEFRLSYFGYFIKNKTHLHELQNAFKILTGEELSITL